MVLKNQPQRRLGPYWDITGRRRRRFKTNAAWARTGALRADGEGGSKPTTLGPVRRHYGQTERKIQNQRRLGPYGGITGRRRGRFKTNDAWARTEALRADGEEDSKPTTLGPVRRHYGQTEKENQGHAPLVFPHRLTLCLTVPFSPLVSPYRFPLSSPRKFSVRGKVALVLWF